MFSEKNYIMCDSPKPSHSLLFHPQHTTTTLGHASSATPVVSSALHNWACPAPIIRHLFTVDTILSHHAQCPRSSSAWQIQRKEHVPDPTSPPAFLAPKWWLVDFFRGEAGRITDRQGSDHKVTQRPSGANVSGSCFGICKSHLSRGTAHMGPCSLKKTGGAESPVTNNSHTPHKCQVWEALCVHCKCLSTTSHLRLFFWWVQKWWQIG